MLGFLARVLGMVTVTEKNQHIEVTGVPAFVIARHINRTYETTRITTNMFVRLWDNGFVIPSFFAVEVHYIFKQALAEAKTWGMRHALERVIAELEKNTWLASTIGPKKSMVDLGYLRELKWKAQPHQIEFLKTYGDMVPRYNLRGYFLASPPGTGKTFMDLALATCVIPRDLAEVVIIISPKPAIKVVWEDTVRELFHRPPKYWVSSTPGPAPVDRKTRYFIFHNESLDRAEKLAKELSTRNIKFFVIIDESHNFNEQSSNRTQRLENVLAGNRYKPYCVWASGSPIKQSALEAIPFLRSCDPYFTPDVEKRYRAIFSSSAVRAQEVVAHRLGIITFKVSKEVVMKNARPTIIRRAIKLPSTLAKPFLLDTIRDEIRAYIDVRMNYYMSKLKEYDALFDSIVAVHAKTVPQTADAQMKLKRYKEIIRELRRRRDARKRAEPWMLGYTKQYESTILLPSLPNSLKRQFRECRTIVKSTKLKVIGEALGKVLIPRRAECSLILAKNCRLDEIIRDSLSKTLVFSSSVRVTLDTNDYLIKLGFSPEVVYQKTNAQLPQIIDRFAKNPLINPVCATFQSLSTAVPMIMASTLVMLNLPFRQYIYDQTVSRVYRLGQPYQVTIYEILLDTGSDSNVSSRAADILSFCREHLDVLMGGEFSGPEDDDVILERVLKTT